MQSGYLGYSTKGLPRALSDLVTCLAGMCMEHLSSINYEADVHPYGAQVQNIREPTINKEPEPETEWDDFYQREKELEEDLHEEPQMKYEVIKLQGQPVVDDHKTICRLLLEARNPKRWTGKIKLADQFKRS